MSAAPGIGIGEDSRGDAEGAEEAEGEEEG